LGTLGVIGTTAAAILGPPVVANIEKVLSLLASAHEQGKVLQTLLVPLLVGGFPLDLRIVDEVLLQAGEVRLVVDGFFHLD